MEDGGSLEVFAGGGGAGENENSGADDGTDSERSQRPGPKSLFEPMAGLVSFSNELVDGLASEELFSQRTTPIPGTDARSVLSS
jgi:hypothetical protein